MIEKFGNLSEFEVSVRCLDRAETRDITIDGIPTDSYKAVWNITKDQLEGIMPVKYGLIEHQKAFEPFINVLKMRGVRDVSGNIKNFGGRVVVEAIIPGLSVEAVEGDTIAIGVRLDNNYGTNGKPMFSGEAFGYRSKCENGLFFGKVMVSKFFTIHDKVADLEKQLLDFVGNVVEGTSVIKSVLVDNTRETMPLEEAKEIVKGEIGTKKALIIVSKILEKESTDTVTKYQLYNAITQYATFNARNEKQRTLLQKVAQKVLIRPKDKLRRAFIGEKDFEE